MPIARLKVGFGIADWRLTNVRFAAHYGFNSDIELGPKSADSVL